MDTDFPILYVKEGCPWCAKASNFLSEQGISFREREVRNDEDARNELEEVSGQSKTPTLIWDGDVLADFDLDDLKPFLRKHGVSFEES